MLGMSESARAPFPEGAPEDPQLARLWPASARTAELEQRARSLEVEVERRQRLSERMARLLELAGDLAHAEVTEKIASIMIDKGVEAVGPTTGAWWTLDPVHGELVMLRARGYSDDAERRFARLPLDGLSPMAAAVRKREPVFIESFADYSAQYPESSLRAQDAVSFDDFAIACLPLLVDGRPLGGLAYAFDGARRFDEGDRTFLRILKRQCAQALDRARLYEAERAARLAAEAAHAALAHAY